MRALLEMFQFCFDRQICLKLPCFSCQIQLLVQVSCQYQRQFWVVRDSPEIRKLEIPPSEFCPISGEWGELVIPDLTLLSLMKSYRMLQIARITAFTITKLLRGNQQGEGVGKISPPPPATRLELYKIGSPPGFTTLAK